jgi:Flp pilus assembly protein TadD
MTACTYPCAAARLRSGAGALAVVAAGLVLGGCSQLGSLSSQLTANDATTPATGLAGAAPASAAADTRTELHKATEYWGKEFAKNPRDAKSGLSYARNLKALGEKRQALAVLQQVSVFHAGDRDVNAEYGRLALEFEQVSLAQKLLQAADDPANPDWKVISARGTALAKQGRYRDAIGFYERALVLAPDQASVLNNLALAHAMEGSPEKAEPLLRRAAGAAGGHQARVDQNLALVLGLQGKYDEAKVAAARDLPPENAAENVDYVRRMVKLDPKSTPASAGQPAPALKGSAAATLADADKPSPWAPQVAAKAAQ